jgi:hypothetical protein
VGSLRTLNSDKYYDNLRDTSSKAVEYHISYLEPSLRHHSNITNSYYYYPDNSYLVPFVCRYGLSRGYLIQIRLVPPFDQDCMPCFIVSFIRIGP